MEKKKTLEEWGWTIRWIWTGELMHFIGGAIIGWYIGTHNVDSEGSVVGLTIIAIYFLIGFLITSDHDD